MLRTVTILWNNPAGVGEAMTCEIAKYRGWNAGWE